MGVTWAGTLSGLLMVVALLPARAADFPENGSFEQEGASWSTFGDPELSWPEGKGGEGARCLRISGGWAISQPAPAGEELAGWLRLSLLARPDPADPPDLALILDVAAQPETEPERSLSLEPAALPAARWHRVEVDFFRSPRHPLCLAFGYLAGGAWLIDDVRVEIRDAPASPPADDAPKPMEPLPDGWQPEGLLDARARTIGTERELLLQVSGIEISIPERIVAGRAHRGALRILAGNRGEVEKELTIAVHAPLGFFVPERTVPIRGGGTTVIDASVQCLLMGSQPVRIEFRSGDEVKAAPLVIESEPNYPVFGAAWTSGAPTPEQLQAAAALPLQLHQVCVLPLGEGVEPEALLPRGTELAALVCPPWSAEACEGAVKTWGARASWFGLHHPRPTDQLDLAAQLTGTLAQAVKAAGLTARILSAPLDSGLPGSPQPSDVTTTPTLRPDALSVPTIVGLRVDGRPSREPLRCWTEFAAGLATLIGTRTETLPVVVSELCARPSGSAELDALALARAILAALEEFANVTTVAARPEDCPVGTEAFALVGADGTSPSLAGQVLSELTRELAGTRSSPLLKYTEEVGPGWQAAVRVRAFMRGSEGILAICNNTGAEVELAIEVRCLPLEVHLLEIGPGGVRRHHTGVFRFSEDTKRLGRPCIFVKLAPSQVSVLSMQLSNAHAAWLAGVEYKPPIPVQEREKQWRLPRGWP